MGLKTRKHAYEFTKGLALGAKNEFKVGGITGRTGVDWTPLSYSKSGTFAEAPVVFAGYGIKAPAVDKQNEYDSYKKS